MIYPLDEFKNEIISQLKELVSRYKCEIRLETPREGLGDFAFPCFQLAPFLNKPASDIAIEISDKIKTNKWIDKAEG